MKILNKNMLFSLAVVAMMTSQAYAELPLIESRSNLSCMMGGVGETESKAMREEAKKWPLNIEFSEHLGNKDAWVSGAVLKILNKDGNVIFEETCNGPMFLAKMAPGKYQLVASYQGVSKKRMIQIEEGKRLKESFNWNFKK